MLMLSGHGLGQVDSVKQVDPAKPVDSVKQIESIKTSPVLKPEVYKFNYKVEVPVTVVAIGVNLLNFYGISKKPGSTEEQIKSLDKSNIPSFDRWSAHAYSKSIDQASYIPFWIAIPLPLLCVVDKKMRKDFWKIEFLYIEALAFTGLFNTTAVNLGSRYRPFTYFSESPINKSVASNAKNSFFAGHSSTVATSCFFFARVYADYHPDSKLKWVFYGGAFAMTATTSIMRNLAGMHFFSDILLGSAVGALSGILIPGLHKIKSDKPSHLTILPFGENGAGFTAIYRL
jgi:membrane-associated phospholipid phosphatase